MIQYAAAVPLECETSGILGRPVKPGDDSCDYRRSLLLRQLYRELAVANPDREAFHELRHRVFAVGSDQFGERREQACLRQAIAIDAIVPCLRPGLIQVAEGSLLLLVIGQRVA